MKLSMRQRSLLLPGRGPRAAATAMPLRSKRLSRPRPVSLSAAASPSPSDLDAPPPPALRLPEPGDRESHARNAAAISFYVRKYLDEEWRLELEEHAELGEAAAEAYKEVVFAAAPRSSSSGEEPPPPRLDVGDVLLAVASSLSARPELFRETFTDGFEVANKVSELLVHGLSGGKTECGCVGELSMALMVEAFEFADGDSREVETG